MIAVGGFGALLPAPARGGAAPYRVLDCPTAVTLLTPPNGAKDLYPPVQLSWEANTDAVYEVFMDGVSRGTTETNSMPLHAGEGTFTWRVTATRPGCGTVTSSTWTFSVGSDSRVRITPSPAPASIGEEITFGINAGERAPAFVRMDFGTVGCGGLSQVQTTSGCRQNGLCSLRFRYPAAGTYQVRATALGSDGSAEIGAGSTSVAISESGSCADCRETSVPAISAVNWTPGTPLANGQAQPYVGQTVTLTAVATGAPLEYVWLDFGDASQAQKAWDASVTHVWTEPGVKNVRVMARNCRGDSVEATARITVSPDTRPVTAAFMADPRGDRGTYLFTALQGPKYGDPTTFTWDFGDGGPIVGPGSRSQLSYSLACQRTYTVTLTAARGTTSASTSRPFTGAEPCTPDALVVADVARNLQGRNSSLWNTELRVHNPNESPLPITVSMKKPSEGRVSGHGFDLLPGETVDLERILDQSGLLLENAKATLWIQPTRDVGAFLPVVSARTHTGITAPHDDFGQFVAVEQVGAPPPPARTLWLMGAQHNGSRAIEDRAGFRTNLTIVNPTATKWRDGAVKLTLLSDDPAYTPVVMTLDPYDPYRYDQMSLPELFGISTDVDLGKVIVKAEVAAGIQMAISATLVNNATNAPIHIPAVRPEVASALVVPDIAHNLRGAANSLWNTEVRLYNPLDVPAELQISLAAPRSVGRTEGSPIRVSPHSTMCLDDLLRFSGLAIEDAKASMWIASADGGAALLPLVSARTHTGAVAPYDDYGQFVAVEQVMAPPTSPRTSWIMGAQHNGGKAIEAKTGFRTNLTVVNPTGTRWGDGTVKLTLFSDHKDYPSVGLVLEPYDPYRYDQISLPDLFGVPVDVDLGRVIIKVEVATATQAIVSAALVNNATNAPIHIPALGDERIRRYQGCSYVTSPSGRSHGGGAEAGTVEVLAPSGCTWRVASNATWLAVVSGTSGMGTSIVSYAVAANPGAARSGTIDLKDESGAIVATLQINQAGGLAIEELTVVLPGNVPLTLLRIPAGTFTMGAASNERGYWEGEGPPHQVTLTQDYYLGKTEVTQRQWLAVMGSNPAAGYGVGDDYPVYGVTWADVCGATGGSSCTGTSFIGRVNQLLGTTKFRPPTEAEWERAARAGTQTEFSFLTPQDWDTQCGSFPEAMPYMWWCGTGWTTHPVGQKLANPFGLFDMHGNVAEVVANWSGTYDTGAVTDPTGPQWGARGGGAYARDCRSASRRSLSSLVGFRLARSPEGVPCTFSISPRARNHGAGGETGNVEVTATPGCAWAATSNDGWLRVVSGATGLGPGTVAYAVAANTTPERIGTLTVAGQTLTVTQAGIGCGYVVTPAILPIVAAMGGTPMFGVRAGSTCPWRADLASSTPWITGLTGGATGNGDVAFAVSPNDGAYRSATILIRSGSTTVATVTVNQAAAMAEATIVLPGNVPLTLVRIPAGTFTMGAASSERGYLEGEGPPHQVTLTQDYYLGKTEVTQRQWVAVMGTNPSYFSGCGPDCPVEQVSWNDICGGATGSSCAATSFIGKVNQLLETARFRMPTEAEWERAARAGTQTEFSFPAPATWDPYCGGFPEAQPYMWFCLSSVLRSHRVGEKLANPYGLYDMHGNAGELVADWYGRYTSAAVTDPTGPITGYSRVSRGGSSPSFASGCRSASRAVVAGPDVRASDVGFRLARSVDEAACTFAIAPTARTHGAGTETGSVLVTAATGCAWAATSSNEWLAIVSGATGNGGGLVGYSVASNATPWERTGTLTIAGRTFTVTQPGGGCAFALVPGTLPTVAVGGGTPTFQVQAGPTCTWTAELASPTPWITALTGGATGNGTVSFAVSANGGVFRIATILIKSGSTNVATMTVTQAAALAETTVILPGNVPLTLVRIPAGTFTMGSPTSERGRNGDESAHDVTLSQDYYIGKTVVTQRQWVAVMGSNPSLGCMNLGIGDDFPVYCVSWNEVCGGKTGLSCAPTSFIGQVNQLLGSTRFRLPTEAEWERAARGGRQTEFSFAVPANWDTGCGSFPEAMPYMWWCGNRGELLTPVAMKLANPFGLFDVHGNVSEWVADWYDAAYYPSSPSDDPSGPQLGSERVTRGGGWHSRDCRAAARGRADPGYRPPFVGFRVAMSP